MPLLYQKRIVREDLRRNPRVLYLFGDNAEERGLGGQAAEMRGEPNAVGIPTKWRPGREEADYFTNEDLSRVEWLLEKAFEPLVEHVQRGGVVVCPMDGLGTGLAELEQRAPRILARIRTHLLELVRYSRPK